MKIQTSLLLLSFLIGNVYAQTPGVSDIGVGYFNGHQFATFGTLSGTTLTGDLGGNAFTINFSGNTRTVLHTITGYGPSLPANSGTFSTTAAELNYSAVPATNTVTFTTALQPLDQMHVIDIENSEGVTFEFLDASNNPVTLANNVKVVSLSTITPTASLNFPSSTMVGVNTAPGKITSTNSDQGFSFIMLTNVVKTIRFIQVDASTGGSWDFTFSKGTPDRGDAPSSYGNATHISFAARLKLGTNGGDAEASAFTGTTASGDDAVSGSTIIDDDDGTALVPTVVNSGAQGQNISSYSISTTVTNSTGSAANVVAWIDWDGDGNFNSTEGVVGTTVPTGSTSASRTFTWTNMALGGGGGSTGTYLRVRTTTGTLTTSTPTGLSLDGEVEDYFVPFAVTLPVTFHSFNAVAVNKSVVLKWATENEQHNKGFEIENSADGHEWKSVGFVDSKATGGNSSGVLEYNYIDDAPLAGLNYYRLKQIDIDGRENYSNIKTVDINASNNGIIINPNPADDVINVQGVKEGDLISLYNSDGKSLESKKANTSQVRFDVSRFARGFYTVVIRGKGGAVKSFKVFKK